MYMYLEVNIVILNDVASICSVGVQASEANVTLKASNEAMKLDIEKKQCQISTLQSSLNEEVDAVSCLKRKLSLVGSLIAVTRDNTYLYADFNGLCYYRNKITLLL